MSLLNINLNSANINNAYNTDKSSSENLNLLASAEIQYYNQTLVNGTGNNFLVSENSSFPISGGIHSSIYYMFFYTTAFV